MQNKWRYEPRKLKGHKSIFHFQPPELEGGGGGGEVSPSTDLLQTLHGTFMQVYKIENKVYCWNYNSKSEMPTLVRGDSVDFFITNIFKFSISFEIFLSVHM